jgi:hypothetical protein
MNRTQKRKVLRLSEAKLEAHGSLTPEAVREEMEAKREISNDPQADYRTRMMAKRFLLDHDWEVYEHQNPATQKIEQKIEIQGVIRLPPKKPIGDPVELGPTSTPS